MPTAVAKQPEALRPYLFHHIGLTINSSEQAEGTCPFCDKEKFYVNAKNSKYICFSCQTGGAKGGGNGLTFLRHLWGASDKATRDYSSLAKDRGIEQEVLARWGLCRSVIDNCWLIPGYSAKGSLTQLYRLSRLKGRNLLLPTPKSKTAGISGHALFGLIAANNRKKVFVCEGLWDGLALWQALRQVKWAGSDMEERLCRVQSTANPAKSLLSEFDVVAVPSCTAWMDYWANFFAGKEVFFLYDNDHTRTHPRTGRELPAPGPTGMLRAAERISSIASSVHIQTWERFPNADSLPDGYDVRDAIQTLGGPRAIEYLYEGLEPYRPERGNGKARRKQVPATNSACRPCDSYKQLVKSWRKALRWTPGLDHALSAMLASVVSTPSVGDQLWLKVIGPAACGKSTLCEALSMSDQYVLAKSTIRGFHSGFKVTGEEDEDNSLLSALYGKTLVTKDGDTLLQSPNLEQILSEARDIYDGTSRTHYRNAISKEYAGIRMTWILSGTSSLRQIDSSELGERFLDCVIMDKIDEDLEEDILWRVANRSLRSVDIESNGDASKHYEPALFEAMSLTGGYVNYLRGNAQELLQEVDAKEEALRACTYLGKFVAYMRARPSTRQEETAEREFATRLVSQLVRLAKCLAVVLQRKQIDGAVLRRVTKIAFDTARGTTLEIVRLLHEAGEDGLEFRSLHVRLQQKESRLRDLMRFLKQIGAVSVFSRKVKGVRSTQRWRLSKRIAALYEKVVELDRKD